MPKNSYQILKRENEKKFLNILNINFNDKNKYFKYDMSEYLYLKKYGADLNDYFVVNSNTFNKLLVSKLQTKQIFLFKNNLLRRIKEYKEEPGIYLFFLRS